ncbi:spore coat associated protein CotJA [Alkaliphilus serpentinus]|uniref:Spore coat associated protein CotJA n=1 Tax=Alkaliphilus serpentinus TaxID=1482731 RepID=A0A833HME4_9FIRM|nr:spore coat associated protein CotJA [Alkaliphilus serpentinus]KAB3527302.1 spore coat associated protein CotJA [Alkaliphilus serpentinus]
MNQYQHPNYMPAMGYMHGIYPIPFMPVCVMLSNAYVPYQYYNQTFPLAEALDKGTYFPDLYQPYVEKDKRGCM